MVHKTLKNTKAESRQSALTSERLYKSGVPLISVRPLKNEDPVLMAVSSFFFCFIDSRLKIMRISLLSVPVLLYKRQNSKVSKV